MKTLRSLALTFTVALSSPALAWWDMGHMTVAAVAYDQLDAAVRNKVDALIKLNPQYDSWVAAAKPADQAKVAFVHASTWADDIKSMHGYSSGSLKSDGPHAADNIGYSDHRRHLYWHFIDLPYAVEGTTPENPVIPNALTQIEAFRDTLTSNASDDIKSYDLVWLIHMVGDVHQPLHATSRFSPKLPGGDAGGNVESVCRSLVCSMKLHAYWDSLLGDHGGPTDAIALANRLPSADPVLAGETDVRSWCEESAAIARQSVYTSAIGDGPGPFTLDDAYDAQAHEIAKTQVALAGARLAYLINAALK